MAKRFSVIFDDNNTNRIERMAERLKVPPNGLLLHFILEKLVDLEQVREGNKTKKEQYA